jgi:class 3 adenylate cyclase
MIRSGSGVEVGAPMLHTRLARASREPSRNGNVLPLTTTQRSLHLLAACVGIAGIALVVWAIHATTAASFASIPITLLAVLVGAAIACGRFPIAMGVRQSFISLDSIPLVLAVLLLPVHLAVLVVLLTTNVAMWGQPRLPGLRGLFWRLETPLAACIAVGAAGWLADRVVDGAMPGPVLLVPAFLVALALELVMDACVVIDLEADTAGSWRHMVDAWVSPVANVFLPTLAAAVLTPYVRHDLVFVLLLPVLLVGMYGALWIANSQQLERRRGERLRDTFSRYVPDGVVDENLETMQQVELGGEQHEVTVLFCDIRGFTSWSEDKGATEVITELNVLLSELSASVMGTGGTLDKFTGDGLMAFWGAPLPLEDHADRACAAALDMLERLERVNELRAADGELPFAIGVGVHSGPAVVGNVGHERRLDYTAIGDTVNTTARLEAATKEIGAVLVASRATIDRLGDDLRARAMLVGDVTMKGKARPVEAWALQPLRPELDGVNDEFAA